MVMCAAARAGMGDALRERLPALWRRIEDAHYSYLETDDSPEKIQQRDKLDGYIKEYLSLVPHECKFGLSETGKVFQRTIEELPAFSAYRAGLGWAALARYAANLLAQPWRKEYRDIRLYSGYYKHEIEANLVGAELLLHAMGYKGVGSGRVSLVAPACPDMVAAVSRDAIIAHAECQIMCQIWENVLGRGVSVTWADVARERAARAGDAQGAAQRLALGASRDGYIEGSEIYSNVPATVANYVSDSRYNNSVHGHVYDDAPIEDPITPMVHPYMVPNMLPPHMVYPHMPEVMPSSVPMMTPYGVPYYYPVQAPYMIPTPVYAPIKQANNIPLNGYPPMPQYRYPAVPTGQLIELDSPSVYENGKHAHIDDRHRRRHGESSRRDSTSKSNFSDVTLPSIPRSDTQPTLSKAKEDGMGTYESWDYVFRNLSSKNEECDRTQYSPSLDRDSRTLDRLDREERRSKYQPTTLDLEDGLRAMNLDRTHDEDAYRTAKVNENLMKLKLDQEKKRAKEAKRVDVKRKIEKEPVKPVVIKADALVTTKVAPDKVKLLTKKDVKDRKEVIRQQSVNGAPPSAAEVRKLKKPAKLLADVDRTKKPLENGHASKAPQPYDIKAQLVVSLDETDCIRPPPRLNGEKPNSPVQPANDRWQCATCTYLNKGNIQACEMCGKSKRGPEIQPLTSGGRECPACTLVNKREARVCDACGTSLEHCPTYI